MSSKSSIPLLLSFLFQFIQFSLCEVELNDKRSEPLSHHGIEKRAQKEKITNINIYGIIGVLVFGAFLVFCFIIAYCLNRKAKNNVILSIPWTLLDFVLQALFIKDHVKPYPKLYAASIIFLIVPVFVNIIFSFFIVLNEKKKRSKEFEDWFHKNSPIAATATILAGLDMSSFKLLYSEIFRLRRFNAPFSDSSKNLVLWGSILNSIIQDVPQLIIQICYRVETQGAYTLIPFMKLLTVAIKLPIGIMGRIYEALKGHYKADKPEDSEKNVNNNDEGIMGRVYGKLKGTNKSENNENNDDNKDKGIMDRVYGTLKGADKSENNENNNNNKNKGVIGRVYGTLKGHQKADKPGNNDNNNDNDNIDLEK